jgi:HD superfamily phosphohydrolase
MTGYIKTATDLVTALDKLLAGPEYFERRLHESERDDPKQIQRWNGTVEVRSSVAPFLAHPSIRRLHNLNQLALIHYVYPSAGQTRFDHVLGVLGATQRMWRRLAHSPTFLLHFKTDDIVKLELLALLHDVNHFPFLHYFQEAGISSVRDASVLRGFLTVPGGSGLVEPGEDPTGKTLIQLLQPYGITEDMIRQVLGDGIPADWTVAMQVIKSIVNSGADVDKMAYVVDDAMFTGVPFGRGVDLEGLLAGADIAEVDTSLGKRWHLVFDKDALSAVESLCFARYWNFTRIYWHHTNRAIEAMIIYTIRELFAAGKDTVSDFLLHTRDVGEAGALEHLANTFEKQMFHKPPIAGLWSNRDLIYRRIWEMPMAENETLLTRLQDERNGLETRRAANERVEHVIRAFVKDERGETESLAKKPGQVILDVPLRNMDLGGSIYIRESASSVRSIDKVSPTVRELSLGFGRMSKTLRVYVAPEIRDALPREKWLDAEFVKTLTAAVVGEQKQGEMR